MEYKRKVDKKRIPICNIMGVNIAANQYGVVGRLSRKKYF